VKAEVKRQKAQVRNELTLAIYRLSEEMAREARSALLPFAFCLLPLVPLHASAQGMPPSDPPSIVTQGDATIMKAPDRAWVQIAAEGRGTKPGDAQRIAADAMTSLQAALRKLGLGDAVRTSGYTLQPEYDFANGKQTLRGYIARNQIEVRIDDLKRVSEVLDAAGASGAGSVSSLRFDLKDKSATELEALRLAVKDATARAEAMAAGAGRTLGPILKLQEQRTSAAVPMFSAMGGVAAGAARAATPIEAGEIQITATVTLTVGIK
jgi:uncharacterized protein YggE